jgi:hypothetical protein
MLSITITTCSLGWCVNNVNGGKSYFKKKADALAYIADSIRVWEKL